MKVLHVVPRAHIAGMELYSQRLAEAQKERHEPYVLVPKGPLSARLVAAGVPYFHPKSGEPGLFSLRQGMAAVRERIGKVDIVMVHADAEHCMAARGTFPEAGIVFKCTGNRFFGFLLAARAVNHWADKAIAISHDNISRMRRAGVQSRRLRLVPNGVPDLRTTEEGRQSLASLIGIDPKRHFVISTLARLENEKSIDVIVSVAARLKQSLPDARFVVAGQGSRRKAFELQAKRLGVSDNVLFPGHVDETGDLLSLSDIYFHPARFEPFGNAISEAMSAKLPVVGARTGGLIDQVVDGGTGYLLNCGDVSGFASRLLELIAAPEMRARLGEAGYARQQDLFTVRGLSDRVDVVFHEAIKARALRS